MTLYTLICGNELNIINCINDVGGGAIPILFTIGTICLFIAPIIIWYAFSKKAKGYGVVSRFFVICMATAWGLCLFFIFPGVLFFSVYCILGIGLPILGLTASFLIAARLAYFIKSKLYAS